MSVILEPFDISVHDPTTVDTPIESVMEDELTFFSSEYLRIVTVYLPS